MTWLNEVDATALQSSLHDLEMAYKHFFSVSKKEKNLVFQNSKPSAVQNSHIKVNVSAQTSRYLIIVYSFPSWVWLNARFQNLFWVASCQQRLRFLLPENTLSLYAAELTIIFLVCQLQVLLCI